MKRANTNSNLHKEGRAKRAFQVPTNKGKIKDNQCLNCGKKHPCNIDCPYCALEEKET